LPDHLDGAGFRRDVQSKLRIREGVDWHAVEPPQDIPSFQASSERRGVVFHLANHVAAVDFKLEAEVLRQRIPPRQVPVPFSFSVQIGVAGLLYLMAVDTPATESARR